MAVILRTTMNSLPFELIEKIIGHVDDEKHYISRSHLLACSLVCRLWLPSSQRRLFHHITFGTWETDADVQRLDQVLLNSPHLASYIQVLELPLWSWQYSDEPLSPLLGKFTHVQKLKISGLPWNLLPADIRQSLCRLLELPSMAFLYIQDAQFICMDDFTNFINHARGPVGLFLYHINTLWDPPHSFKLETKPAEDNKDKFEGYRICHLTRLDMMCRDNSVFVNWLLGPRTHLDVSHIHTLHICLHETDNDSVNRLLRAIGSSLKHISIFLLDEYPVLVNLAFNVNIEVLSLVRMDMGHKCLSTLRRLLSTVDASNHIHHIALCVDPLCFGLARVDREAWDEVYSVLAGPHFQFLRVLDININITPGGFPGNGRNESLLQESKDMVAAHPLLATRGVRVSLCQLPAFECIFCLHL
ncbi:hypothetical protein JB92DRAFT_3117551 [Gautieria morchelliformis]|nr:hypothetical protein JB92DRAFT_3117551 [Gautieria morchelliformis]